MQRFYKLEKESESEENNEDAVDTVNVEEETEEESISSMDDASNGYHLARGEGLVESSDEDEEDLDVDEQELDNDSILNPLAEVFLYLYLHISYARTYSPHLRKTFQGEMKLAVLPLSI